jgi:ABC-2 type transport system ATP-binding protein
VLTSKITILKNTINNDGLEITVKDGEALVPRVVEIATENGIRIEAVVLRQPSLEDVFLHYTGRAIRSESGGELRGEAAGRRRAIR